MNNIIRTGICQMQVGKEKEKNIARAYTMIKKACTKENRLVILPEMFNCPYSAEMFPDYAESYPHGPTFKMLSQAAREEAVYLVGGSVPELEDGRVYNTSFVFGPTGELLGKHQKLHLFDVDLEGGLSFHESNTLAYGKQITVIKTEIGTFGVAVCYDIRFPELIRLMTLAGAELIIIPAAFNMKTGPAHWELLFKARAIDNQVFLVGAAPARNIDASYVSYGNSIVVDPWGRTIARADEKETILHAEINLSIIKKVRNEFPLLKQRRTDLYG